MTNQKAREVKGSSGLGGQDPGPPAGVEFEQLPSFYDVGMKALSSSHKAGEGKFVSIWFRAAVRPTTEPATRSLFGDRYMRIFDVQHGVPGAKERLHAHLKELRAEQQSAHKNLVEARARYRELRRQFGKKHGLPVGEALVRPPAAKAHLFDPHLIRRALMLALLRERVITVAEFRAWHEALAKAQKLPLEKQEKLAPLFAAALRSRRSLHKPKNA